MGKLVFFSLIFVIGCSEGRIRAQNTEHRTQIKGTITRTQNTEHRTQIKGTITITQNR